MTKFAPELMYSADKIIQVLWESKYVACTKLQERRKKEVHFIKVKRAERLLRDFILQYVILHPKSRYIQRLASEFHEN
jgi:hypothetical protein